MRVGGSNLWYLGSVDRDGLDCEKNSLYENFLEVGALGRNAQPVDLLAVRGKKHLTKTEITTRKKQEAKLRSGIRTFRPSPQVKNDLIAHAMFKKLHKLYRSIEYVERLDENVINRYCLLHSEYTRLRDMRQDLMDQYTAADPVERLALTDRILELDKRIEKKMDLLVKLEDRLFLNPTARIKNVPKKTEKEPDDPNADLFD